LFELDIISLVSNEPNDKEQK